MLGRQAKTLSLADVNDLLVYAGCTRIPAQPSDRAAVDQGRDAAGEIASLTWDMVIDPKGRIGGVIELRTTPPKNAAVV